MSTFLQKQENELFQLRLLLEEVCCDLCRFHHLAKDGCRPEDVVIDREFYLGEPGAFADMRVAPPGGAPYFVEVKFGYSAEALLRHLSRKYGPGTVSAQSGSKVILVVSGEDADWKTHEAHIKTHLNPALQLETWDEQRLLQMMRVLFQTDFRAITAENLLDLRQAIDRAKGFIAFGGSSLADYEHDPLKAQLLWHFGFWRLRQLRERHNSTARDILVPRKYERVAVLLADLCSFSSYVRDTADSEIVRDCLTAFYSKARYQIINNGGMLYQFAGDEVIGFFGIPDDDDSALTKALATAEALLSIGESVTNHWQRRIDRMQTSGGVHIGMAVGDLQIVSLRPFSRLHVGAIGDCINVAARLMSTAGESETLVSNSFYQRMPEAIQGRFSEAEPVEARNVGRIKSWKFVRKESCKTFGSSHDV